MSTISSFKAKSIEATDAILKSGPDTIAAIENVIATNYALDLRNIDVHTSTKWEDLPTIPLVARAMVLPEKYGTPPRHQITGGVPGFNGGVNGGTEPAPLKLNSDNTKDSQTLLLLVPVKTR